MTSTWSGMNPIFGIVLVAMAATGSTWFGGVDGGRQFIITILGIVALVLYRFFRKWPDRPVTNKWDFLERNWVELILAGIVLPNAYKDLMSLIESATQVLP